MELAIGTKPISVCLFREKALINPIVHYLLSHKQQTGTVRNTLVNIVESRMLF